VEGAVRKNATPDTVRMVFDDEDPGDEMLMPPQPAVPGMLAAPAPPPEPPDDEDRMAHMFNMSEQERAASRVDVPIRSRWDFPGKGTVEVRGTSPLMVWFSQPDAPALAQATLYRHEFLKRATRL
jgi:hypothetical protein